MVKVEFQNEEKLLSDAISKPLLDSQGSMRKFSDYIYFLEAFKNT